MFSSASFKSKFSFSLQVFKVGGEIQFHARDTPLLCGFVPPAFGARRGGAASAPARTFQAPFGIGGALAVEHPEIDRTLHMRNAKHKHGVKFGAMGEKELAQVPVRAVQADEPGL